MNPVRQVALGLLVPVMLFAGCQTGEKLTLDATSRPVKEPVTSYSLTVTDPVIEKDSLRHKEAERLVKAALAGNGFHEAPDAAHADMIIKVDYGIDAGRPDNVTVTTRVYGPGPGIPVQQGVMTGSDGTMIPIIGVQAGLPGTGDYIGDRVSTSRQVIYTKRLMLQARRAKADRSGEPEDVFALEVESRGESHDLRKTLPVLAAVALDHLGEESNGRKQIKMTDAEAIAFVKNPAIGQ